MAELKGTNTEKNLQAAFAGESQFKALHGGDVSSDIEANLRDAAAGENYEHTTMYKDFADEAEKEGFAKIAYQMREVGKIEARHEARYLALAAQVSGNKVSNQ